MSPEAVGFPRVAETAESLQVLRVEAIPATIQRPDVVDELGRGNLTRWTHRDDDHGIITPCLHGVTMANRMRPEEPFRERRPR